MDNGEAGRQTTHQRINTKIETTTEAYHIYLLVYDLRNRKIHIFTQNEETHDATADKVVLSQASHQNRSVEFKDITPNRKMSTTGYENG